MTAFLVACVGAADNSTATISPNSCSVNDSTVIDPYNCQQYYILEKWKQGSPFLLSQRVLQLLGSYNSCAMTKEYGCHKQCLIFHGSCPKKRGSTPNYLYNNCSQYLDCSKRQAVIKSCVPGQQFDQWKKTCVPANQASCASPSQDYCGLKPPMPCQNNN